MNQVPKSGRALQTIGKTLIAMGSVLAVAFYVIADQQPELLPVAVLAILLAIALIYGGGWMFWRGRQYAARETSDRIFNDGKSDVLYLRTFESDASFSAMRRNRPGNEYFVSDE